MNNNKKNNYSSVIYGSDKGIYLLPYLTLKVKYGNKTINILNGSDTLGSIVTIDGIPATKDNVNVYIDYDDYTPNIIINDKQEIDISNLTIGIFNFFIFITDKKDPNQYTEFSEIYLDIN